VGLLSQTKKLVEGTSAHDATAFYVSAISVNENEPMI